MARVCNANTISVKVAYWRWKDRRPSVVLLHPCSAHSHSHTQFLILIQCVNVITSKAMPTVQPLPLLLLPLPPLSLFRARHQVAWQR